MTTRLATNVIPFRPAANVVPLQAAHVLRETHRKLAECWEIRAESRALRRRILERQKRIEKLLSHIEADVERA